MTATDGTLVQAECGESLDAAAVPGLMGLLTPALNGGEVVLSLGGVHFADSAGLGLLVRLHREHPGRLKLSQVGPTLAACLARVPSRMLPPRIEETS